MVHQCMECGVPLYGDEQFFCSYCGGDDGKDEEYYREQRELQLANLAASCTCGSWKMTDEGEVIHVADCCCGAE